MTGRHIHAHGMTANMEDQGTSVRELPDTPELLSRKLRAAGYHCGYTGKWHLGGRGEWFGAPVSVSLPTTRGFEGIDFPGHGNGGFEFPEYKEYLRTRGFEHRVERHPDDAGEGPAGVLEGPVESTVPYFLAEHTISLIERFREAGEPFFIWHSNWGPHAPYYAPEAYYDIYRNVEIPPWPNYNWPAHTINGPHQARLHPRAHELSWDDWARAIRHYYAFTTLIDEQIGRILRHLETTGLVENTIVIFTSDHGETLGSHGGLIDKGWHHFEEIQRIGLIIKDPRGFGDSGTPPGTAMNEWASLLDVYPTILSLAGARYDVERLHGCSLLPLLQGGRPAWRDEIFVEFGGLGAAASMVTCRHGDIKYGWNCSNLDEMYDLAVDPHETVNVIDDPAYAATAGGMRDRIYAFMERTNYVGRGVFRISRLGRLW